MRKLEQGFIAVGLLTMTLAFQNCALDSPDGSNSSAQSLSQSTNGQQSFPANQPSPAPAPAPSPSQQQAIVVQGAPYPASFPFSQINPDVGQLQGSKASLAFFLRSGISQVESQDLFANVWVDFGDGSPLLSVNNSYMKNLPSGMVIPSPAYLLDGSYPLFAVHNYAPGTYTMKWYYRDSLIHMKTLTF